MEQTPRQDKPLSQEDFKAVIEAAGMTYEESTVDVSTLSGPIANPEVTRLSPEICKQVENCAVAMRTWLTYPTITDLFPNQSERRAWRDQMEKRYGENFAYRYQYNKLKGGNLFAITPQVEYLEILLGTSPDGPQSPLLDNLKSLPKISQEDFNEMPLKQQLELVHGFESTFIRFLTFVTSPKTL